METNKTTLFENFRDRDKIDSPMQTKSELVKSDSNTDTPFTPNTLTELDKEIFKNKKRLDSLEDFCNKDVKDSVKDILLDEQKYLLSQKANHLESVLHEAKNTPLYEVDTDKLDQEVKNLKEKVTKLEEESNNLSKLKDNKD